MKTIFTFILFGLTLTGFASDKSSPEIHAAPPMPAATPITNGIGALMKFPTVFQTNDPAIYIIWNSPILIGQTTSGYHIYHRVNGETWNDMNIFSTADWNSTPPVYGRSFETGIGSNWVEVIGLDQNGARIPSTLTTSNFSVIVSSVFTVTVPTNTAFDVWCRTGLSTNKLGRFTNVVNTTLSFTNPASQAWYYGSNVTTVN